MLMSKIVATFYKVITISPTGNWKCVCQLCQCSTVLLEDGDLI